MNFVSQFVEFTQNAEPPESFFRWGAIATLGAVMRDNVYHEWQYGILYPNLFILLVAPPGVGKQLPMRMSSDLIREVGNTKIISGSASMQAVIKALGTHETGEQKGASCILYSEELSSFYVKDQNTNELLTDLSDYHKVWERNLISWSVKLNKVCVSLFGASNEILLKTVFDSSAIYGGLLSRTLVVLEKRKRLKDLMISKTNGANSKAEELKRNMVAHLRALSKASGPIVFSPKAEKEFELWYQSWDENRGKTGIEMRMKTHIKKVAICLAMGEAELDRIIQKSHVEEAMDLCLNLYRNYQVLTMESGKASTAHPAAVLLRALSEAPNYELGERQLLRRFIGELNITILTETSQTLEKAELITCMIKENETFYRLTTKALDIYLKEREKSAKV